ncbi:hypothetical protein [Niastella vici]|nr:hypothetical protein [Niastella vici]
MSNNFELSDEEKSILQKQKDLVEAGKKKAESFWLEEYPHFTIDEKIKYWLASIHRGMRTQGEATADEYSEFSAAWYQHVKEKEPDFDSLFEKVVPLLGFYFDWKEYEKRIKAT